MQPTKVTILFVTIIVMFLPQDAGVWKDMPTNGGIEVFIHEGDGDLFEGLLVDNCTCPEPYSTQKIIRYRDRCLAFCSLDFIQADSTTREFSLMDDQGQTLLYGDYSREYKIISFVRPFQVIERYDLPVLSSDQGLSQVYKYTVVLEDSEFLMKKEFIYDPETLPVSRRDSLLTVFHNQPRHKGRWEHGEAPLVEQEMLEVFFLGAVNGDKECMKAFDNLKSRYNIFGPAAQSYHTLKDFLEAFKKLKKEGNNP